MLRQTAERLYSVHDLSQFCQFLELSAPLLFAGMTSYIILNGGSHPFLSSFGREIRQEILYLRFKATFLSLPLFRYTIHTQVPSHDLLYNVRVD